MSVKFAFTKNWINYFRGGTYDTETLVSYLTAMGEMKTKYLYLAGTERFRGRVRSANMKYLVKKFVQYLDQVHSCRSKEGSPSKTVGASKQHNHPVSQGSRQREHLDEK